MKSELQNAINAFQSGDLINARLLVDRYLDNSNSDPDALILLAAVHAADANYSEVVKTCNKVLEMSPHDIRALYNAAVACQMTSDHHGVLFYTNRIIGADGENLAVLLMRVISLYETGDVTGSFNQATKVLELDNITIDPVLQIVRHYKNAGSFDCALSFINIVLKKVPVNPVFFIEKIRILIDMGDLACAESMLTDTGSIPDAIFALAKSCIYSKTGRTAEAISVLEEALSVAAHPDLLTELGKLYTQTTQYDKAKSLYENNIRNGVRLAENYHALGNIYNLYDDYQSAIQAYNNALIHSPMSEPTCYNLALVYEKKGNYASAISTIKKCPTRSTSALLKQMYVRMLSNLSSDTLDVISKSELIVLIEDKSLDCQPLSNFVTDLIRKSNAINNLVCYSLTDDLESFGTIMDIHDMNKDYEDALLLKYLSHLSVTNYEFECFIRMLRKYLLIKYDMTGTIKPDLIDLYSAISIQCFVTGYVFLLSEYERSVLEKLSGKLAGREADRKNLLLVVALSMYIPVNHIIDTIGDDALHYIDSKLVHRLLKIQFYDRVQEEGIYASIDSSFDIDDDTSILVRNQYEDSPYPVWERLTCSLPRDIINVINEVSPYRNNSVFNFNDPDVLIAGCGTGSHVILSSMRVKSKSITAIDLSKRSLAFAIRKSEEYGLDHVKFFHMDILKLPSLGKVYDVIESIGVIHHMKDPALGLNCLVQCLKPGGLINLALYSSIARRNISKAKSLFDRSGHRITDDEIRLARVKLMSSNDRTMIENFSTLSDFFALHECRDLIFHECEHTYRISDLSLLINEAGLEFIGFDLNDTSVATAYRKMFPGDDMTNLENWDAFENRYPDTFIGMYNFWCYKL